MTSPNDRSRSDEPAANLNARTVIDEQIRGEWEIDRAIGLFPGRQSSAGGNLRPLRSRFADLTDDNFAPSEYFSFWIAIRNTVRFLISRSREQRRPGFSNISNWWKSTNASRRRECKWWNSTIQTNGRTRTTDATRSDPRSTGIYDGRDVNDDRNRSPSNTQRNSSTSSTTFTPIRRWSISFPSSGWRHRFPWRRRTHQRSVAYFRFALTK